ncbi:5-formyltetrahydrofolate cyclo-ligase [Candidatus Viridilinea mediisalina]|uniref:5-formyltetrahydrofolate cyclo-ligase n=1 Tax=Candidatus Viridilinea mediisalina TaxID=2024553 RepID=A0A2A6RPD5_9CHLR|nr:5-formyltetrahydrofolate cyclo-ligase [Candidatus Viridilinea mediisalina]PDW04729.1 5-formyltetrahydrofolate cyclo-ligase [Candidatus Viridilinea mediisalina]
MEVTSDVALLTKAKRRLRRSAHEQRNLLTDRAQRSARIQTLIESLTVYREAQALHCYLAIRSEVETRPLIGAALAAGKAVACPFVDAQGLVQHSWLASIAPTSFTHDALGLPQPNQLRPAYAGEWQLTLVPLLAFDRAGYRLGYGKGYYDRILATTQGLALGLAFACQEVTVVPREAHDRPLDLIVTEAEVIWV